MTFDFGGRPRPLRPDRVDPPPGGGGEPVIPRRPRGGRPWWLIPGGIVALLVVLVFLVLATAGFWANILWFDSLGYRHVLFTRYAARLVAFLIGLAVAALFIGANVLIAARVEGGLPTEIGGYAISRRLERWLLVGGIAVLSFFFATAVGSQWDLFLRFLHRTPFGVSDPQFHHDVAFYVFTLPVIQFWRTWLMTLIIFTIIVVVALYAAKQATELLAGRFRLPPHMRAHLSVLGACFLFAMALGYWIDTRELVYSTRGVVIGASYTDVNAQVPANYILLGISVVAALILLANVFARQLPLFLGTLAVWFIAAILIGAGYPAAVQAIRVRPNELSKETPYIGRNIDATRQAYNLASVDAQQLPGVGDPTRADITANQTSVQNIRLWDPRVIRQSFTQLQQIRQYYAFDDVDVERYTVNGQYRQVMLSPREIAANQLAAQSQTWQNRHLIYTHGYGVVASAANEVDAAGNPVIGLGDIPPAGPLNIPIQEPRIYYGQATSDYVVVNALPEFDRPSGTNAQSEGDYTSYSATNGVSIGNIGTKALFAAYLGEPKLLLSGDISGKSQLLFRRTVTERLSTLAPFLRYDGDPYLSIVDGRLIWVVDGYTLTSRYPYATKFAGEGTIPAGFNYIRNSVKATVDAYDGTVRLYVVDESDPLVRTFRAIYPSLFAPLDSASASLRSQFRYPEDLFDVQTRMYARYHVTDPRVFYGSEDLWAIANEQVGEQKQIQPISSFYLLLRLPGQQSEEFAIVRPFTPGGGTANRQNMVAYMAGRSDGANYGKLVVYEFPRQLTVQGPQQVEARINQEPDISKEITLLDQAGSRVIFGNFLVIPIGNTLLYVEPLYVQATNSPFPQLKRVIVASQSRVVMRNTLDDALTALLGNEPVSVTPPTGTTTTAPAATGDTAARAAEALQHFQNAQNALKTADWATYGAELAQVQQILQQLSGAATPTAPTAPAGTPGAGTATATARPPASTTAKP
jgi:uncharacterized membrane protein (UPF0182 family)